ncbi:hypothetical protein IFM89_001406 [Coptis chinensis]|uniref:Uncharacterized protein n=1 Tax=Coptis chinensis TaxID=261450 RepID=A0A835LYE7_9MAGN|nr:hypothetical protein IFM89_001406 [Coptis chinensis]
MVNRVKEKNSEEGLKIGNFVDVAYGMHEELVGDLSVGDGSQAEDVEPPIVLQPDLGKSNLYGNKLSGGIPPGFERLESMMSLNLSSNNLKGPIPIEQSQIGNLDTLNVSYNNLAGDIPLGKKFSMFPPSSFVGNPGLCGPWVDSPQFSLS